VSGTRGLWLRWSWRDLRRRKGLVVTIALIIAIGTGSYAGLGGTSQWRLASNDASYAALQVHDLRVTLPIGASVPAGTLASMARQLPHASDIAASQERLVQPIEVDASHDGETILVAGSVVGASGTGVDDVWVADGRPGVVLEKKFADRKSLPSAGTIRVSGGRTLTYTGVGLDPEYFIVANAGTSMASALDFAVVFAPLDVAQQLSGRPGEVNDLVLRVRPGANRDVVQAELTAAAAGVGGTVTNIDDDRGHRTLYEDAKGDQEYWNLFAVLILLGASFAAFNLVTRIVESERREIGVGMALGVPRRSLALRHLLVGAQIALVGAVAGVGVGYLMGAGMRSFMQSFLPLPVWKTPFPVARYAEAALLGFLLPLMATALPVWRALRVEPVDAIRSGAYAAAGNRTGLAPLLRGVRLPGRIFRQLPFRNALRAPRRTLLTALGVAAAITSLVAVLGSLDSFFSAIDSAEHEITTSAPDRLTVGLDWFHPVDSAEIRRVAADPTVGRVEPLTQLVGTVRANGHEVDLTPQLVDLRNGMWRPTLHGAIADVTSGIVLSEKAASDLGVRPGDTVQFEHPVREGAGYRMVQSPVVVSATHPLVLRSIAYLDQQQASLFGLEGLTNGLVVSPSAGHSAADVERALFGLSGVNAAQPVAEVPRLIRQEIDSFVGILRIAEAAVLALALLIAFNSASITVDERAREEATMFAFGLRLRAVLSMLTTETVLMGLLGTVAGIAGGFLVLRWMIEVLLARTMPDLRIVPVLSTGSIVATLVLGVLVVALAPLAMAKRLRAMDIPSTLRVLE